MASVDNLAERLEAEQAGWRTFRVLRSEEELLPGEIRCPASAEAGRLTTCDRCLLCDGTSHKHGHNANSIAITVHGYHPRVANFNRRAELTVGESGYQAAQ